MSESYFDKTGNVPWYIILEELDWKTLNLIRIPYNENSRNSKTISWNKKRFVYNDKAHKLDVSDEQPIDLLYLYVLDFPN